MILSREDFPLRLPHAVVNEAVFDLNGDALTVTSDGRLMLWDRANVGAVQLCDHLGSGKPLWQGWDESGLLMIVCGILTAQGLSIIRVDDRHDVEITRLDSSDTPRRVTGFGGQVFLVSDSHAEAFSPGESRPIGKTRIPQGLKITTHSGIVPSASTNQQSATSRFFTEDLSWFALAPGSNGPVFANVPAPKGTLGMFDSRGQGIVYIFGLDRAMRDADNVPGIFCHDDLLHISNDGCSILISANSTAVDTLNVQLEVQRGFASSQPLLHRDLYRWITDRSLRNRFNGIFVLDQSLHLRTIKGDILMIKTGGNLVVNRGQPKIVMIRPAPDVMPNWAAFEDTPSPPGTGYTLKVAEWSDGSRAWLDSRCLLHLKSARRPPRNGQIQCEKRVFLDPDIDWESVTSDGHKIFAAGYGEKANHTALVLASWDPGKPDDPIQCRRRKRLDRNLRYAQD